MKMKSKSKIEWQLERKSNSLLVDTIILAKKHKGWHRVAEVLASPRKQRIEKNVDELEKNSKDGEFIVVPGKVLAQGELNKKLKVAALSFSEGAKAKILKSKGEVIILKDEIKKNPEAKGIKILE